MPNTTAVLPSRYDMQALKHSDPRFYAGKDMVVAIVRKDNSYIPPESAIVVPLLKRIERVSLRNVRPSQIIQRVEGTNPRQHVPGRT
jgi:hypothetical protein